MNLELTLVPFGQLTYVIPGILPYLKKSEAWTMGRAKTDDIVRFLLDGTMNLWLVFDPDTMQIYGYNITEVKQYPQCKMLVIQYSAGEPHSMQFIEEKMHQVLDQFAKDADCAGIEAMGRPGWGPHLRKRGYTVQTVCYEKFFSGELQ